MRTTRQTNRAEGSKGEFVFTMGLPAAGKSTMAEREVGATHQLIDSDCYKEMHPDYDPKNPSAVHEWSSAMADADFEWALVQGGNWVWARTGSTAELMARDMERARRAGFSVRLLYVTCTLETSLRRNARRERTVPKTVIREKAEQVEASFRVLRQLADRVDVIDNDADWTEQEAA